MRPILRWLAIVLASAILFAGDGSAQSPTIASKTPVFAGACKACPWGILAIVTADALKFYGYDTQICWVCATSMGPRQVADKTKPVMRVIPAGALPDPTVLPAYYI